MFQDRSPIAVEELQKRAKAVFLEPSKSAIVHIQKGPQQTRLPGGEIIYEKSLDDLHPAAKKIYLEELAHRPRVPTEGFKGFNGRMVCFVPSGNPAKPYSIDENDRKHFTLMEMPYDYATAHRLAVERGLMTDEEAKQYNPMLANVSRLVGTEIDGEQFIVGQEKSKGDLGEKEFHAALTAGGVTHKELVQAEEDPFCSPLIEAVEKRGAKEVGLDIETDDVQFDMYIDESSIGMINLVQVVQVPWEKIKGDYDRHVHKSEILESELKKRKPNIPSLVGAKLNNPGGLVLVKADDKFNLAEGLLLRPGAEDLQELEDPMEMRPYSYAIAAICEAVGGVRRLF